VPDSRIAASRSSTVSTSTSSGFSPDRPSRTALSLPWPLPVRPSDPYRMAFTRAVRPSSPSWCSPRANLCAAAIGPPVWELDGPIPILKRSKTLIAIDGRLSRSVPGPAGRAPAGMSGLARGEGGVLLGGEQVLGVALGAHPEHPALTVRVTVDQRRVVHHGLVDLDHLAADRRVDLAHGLGGLHLADRLPGLDGRADLGQLHVHH